MFVDSTLTCRDCGQAFTFTSGEQDAFASRGYEHAPSRCQACRAQRKTNREAVGDYGSHHSSERAPRELFAAICASCGQQAQLPFQPTGDKAVYCSTCFEQRRRATRSGRGGY